MKFAVQALVLGIVTIGASAAIGSSYKTTTMMPTRHVVSAIPVPDCDPGHPCPTPGK